MKTKSGSVPRHRTSALPQNKFTPENSDTAGQPRDRFKEGPYIQGGEASREVPPLIGFNLPVPSSAPQLEFPSPLLRFFPDPTPAIPELKLINVHLPDQTQRTTGQGFSLFLHPKPRTVSDIWRSQ